MIVEAKVKKSFKHTNTGLVWFEGDTFKGNDEAAAQLAEMGYLDFGGHAPTKTALPALSTLTVRELRAMCEKEGIEVPDKAKKAEIIAAIEATRR
jgi:hypothetical protein